VLRKRLSSPTALFVFEAAARHRNFTRAGEELNVTQPAVSRMISRLEQHLGCRLFDRTTSQLELTTDGDALHRAVTAGFMRIEYAVEELKNRNAGKDAVTLSISSALATHWFIPRLEAFYREFPSIDLRFQLISGEPLGSVEDVDLATRSVTPDDDTVDQWLFAEEVIAAVSSPHYLQTHGSFAPGKATEHHTLISLTRPRISWRVFLESTGQNYSSPQLTLEFSDYGVVIQAAMNGQGIALGWISVVASGLITGSLVQACPGLLRTGRHYSLVASRSKPLRAVVIEVRDWMLQQMHDQMRSALAMLS